MDQNQAIKPNIKRIIDHLNIFLEQLRLSGYKIGVDSCLRVPELISRLIATGKIPDNIQTLEQYLIALLCTSKREKADFKDRFSTWIAAYEVPHKDQSTVPNQLKQLNRRAWKLITFFSVLMLIIGTVSFFCFKSPIDSEKTKIIATTEKPLQEEATSNQPKAITLTLPDAITPTIGPTDDVSLTDEDMARIGIIMGCFLIALGMIWVLWWRHQADRFLTQVSTDEEVVEKTIYLKGYHRKLFQSIMMVRTARKYRRHYQIDSLRLDPNQTVIKTCDNGGQFTPVYGKINVIPEYLVLIDRITFSDHQSGWIDSLLDRFVENDVYLERYYFDGTPQMCFPDKEGARPIRLDQLIGKYPNHRVILFTDGDYFIDPFTGNASSWIKTFNGWSDKAVLMPGFEPCHQQRKETLEHADFIVLPSTEKGLAILIDHIQQNQMIAYEDSTPQSNYPDLLRRNPGQWLDRNGPEEYQQIDLINTLKTYLGSTGYEWLCACAIFPKIDRQLTHFTGESLGLFNDQDLVNLSRLPWFRYNKMPEWMRRRLLNDLSDSHAEKAREKIKALFLPDLYQGMALTLSTYKSWLGKRLIKTVLKRLSRKQPVENDLCDYIFLTFLNKPLSFKVSKQINKMIGRRKSTKKIFVSLITVFSIVLTINTVFKVYDAPPVHDSMQLPTETNSVTKSNPSSFKSASDMTFVWIKPGKFIMGSPKDEPGRDDDEKQHEVVLTKGYYMQTTEVTQGQWKSVMGENPSSFKDCGDNCPVENVSWEDVQHFIEKLNKKADKYIYRLPTEAEWEYAARAGTTTAYSFGNDSSQLSKYGNFCDFQCTFSWKDANQDDHYKNTAPVKSYSPNALGLYDMHGNVWEWCSDGYGDYPITPVIDPEGGQSDRGRLLRGGSWFSLAGDCRSAYRFRGGPDRRSDNLGFRLAASLSSAPSE
ncbi:MAG: formylglycine-generating enzyme family protein [Candidatus Magnetomorum sp.]|nr:formylglycine-generating enzyme family protein [Candidatus Magnetomorum sp.]